MSEFSHKESETVGAMLSNDLTTELFCNLQHVVHQGDKAEGITLKAAKMAVDVTFASMAQTLARSGRVEIRGIGSFKVKDYEGYSGRNPVSGEVLEVKAKRLPVFRVGKELRERVDGGK